MPDHAHPGPAPAPAPGRFARLTPLAEGLAQLVAAVHPVAVQRCSPQAAVGAVLATPVQAPAALPLTALALADGLAVRAADTHGASPYMPLILTSEPQPIACGQALPPGCDAVLPADVLAGGVLSEEAVPFQAVRRRGEDVAAGEVLLPAGQLVQAMQIPLLTACGVESVSVRRPAVRLLSPLGPEPADLSGDLVAGLLSGGGSVERVAVPERSAAAIAAALAQPGADLLVLIGGTGFGPADVAAAALQQAGRVIAHGLALAPGMSAGCGLVGAVPVVLLPGRFEGAVAAALALVLPLIAHLSGARAVLETLPPVRRKLAARVGLAELALLAVTEEDTDLLALGDLPLSALLRASHYCLVPPQSEGCPAGTRLAAYRLPWG